MRAPAIEPAHMPPAKPPVTQRRPITVRVLVDRLEAMQQYAKDNGVTSQAVYDQAFDEYLWRRNIHPDQR